MRVHPRAVYLGIDPGLALCGVAVAEVDRAGRVTPLLLRVLRTEKTGRPIGEDIAQRTELLFDQLTPLHPDRYHRHPCVGAFIESVSMPRSAAAATKLAAAWATVAVLLRLRFGRVVSFDPREIRRWLFAGAPAKRGKVRAKEHGGGTEVDKSETVRRMTEICGPALTKLLDAGLRLPKGDPAKIRKDEQEHVADALATIVVGVSAERTELRGAWKAPLAVPGPKVAPKAKTRPRVRSGAA